MKCCDVERVLPDLLDGVPIEDAQDFEVQSHLRTCAECSELVSDLKLIASEARHLAASEEPSPRVWARIANDLRAEGLIREPEFHSLHPVAVPSRRRWNPLWLAPVAAAVLAAGSYVLVHRPSNHTTAQLIQQPAAQQPIVQQPIVQQPGIQQAQPPAQPQSSAQSQPAQQPVQQAKSQPVSPARTAATDNSASGPVETADASPAVSDNEFLSEVSQRAPTMRATYANQLQAVNNEIRETKAYLNQYPGDLDARQHLLEVYQQKALLYQMALDRIQ